MSIRLCSYNIEWFNRLFNKDNSLKTGTEEKARLDAIAEVLKKIDADFIGVVEAPNSLKDGSESTIKKLEKFASSASLRTKKAAFGYISGGMQELAILYDPDKLTVTHSPGGKEGSKGNPPFNGELFFDTDEDRIKEVYKFYRPPLEALVKSNGSGHKFKVIVAHTKSKGIFNAMDMIHWERESLRNRLKLYAECTWISRRVNEWLEAGTGVVVMGDINDGPGMDYYEMKYGRSAVEVIMGDLFEPDKILRNLAGRPKWTSRGWKPASTRFKDRMTEDYVRVLIDHILVSQDIPVSNDTPHRIWNPFENDEAEPLKSDLLKASDHFPITLDLNL